MNPRFSIQCRRSAGNLHINLTGEFSRMCAWVLLKTIKRQCTGAIRIFVNTAGLCRIKASGADLFKTHMTCNQLPSDWLYFKGEKGFQIAPNGSRVLICKPHSRQGFLPSSLKLLPEPCTTPHP